MRRLSCVGFICLASVWLAAASCGGSTTETSTSVSTNIEFGSGEIPDTVPESFPVMQGSVVSSTLVNRDTGFTEMILRMPSELGVAVQYYQQSLEPAGFEIETSAAESDTRWDMTAQGDGVAISIAMRLVQPQVTEAVLTFENR